MISRVLFLAALLLFSTVAQARSNAPGLQQLAGAISLEVKDNSSKAMEASGILENLATGVSLGFQTDMQGKYTFAGLAYSRYHLEVSKEGFAHSPW